MGGKQVEKVVRNLSGETGWRPRPSHQDSASSPADGVMPDLSKMATVRLTFLKGHFGCMSVERLKGQQQKQKNNSGSPAVLAPLDMRNGTVSPPRLVLGEADWCPEPNTLTVGLSEQRVQAVLLLNITASLESFKYLNIPYYLVPNPAREKLGHAVCPPPHPRLRIMTSYSHFKENARNSRGTYKNLVTGIPSQQQGKDGKKLHSSLLYPVWVFLFYFTTCKCYQLKY